MYEIYIPPNALICTYLIKVLHNTVYFVVFVHFIFQVQSDMVIGVISLPHVGSLGEIFMTV